MVMQSCLECRVSIIKYKEMERAMKKETKMFSLYFRCFQDLRRCCPGVFLASGCYAAMKAAAPYAAIYCSARLLDEMAGGQSREGLLFWAAAAVLSAAGLALWKAVLLRWKKIKEHMYGIKKQYLFMEKALTMDFSELDKQETQDLRSQISQNEQWGNWGINKLFTMFEHLIEAGIGILGALALTVGFFLLPVPQTAGGMTVLNHPGVLLGMVLVLVLATLLGPLSANKALSYWAEQDEESRFANRIFSSFGVIFTESFRDLDIRMYNQQKIAEHYLNGEMAAGTIVKSARLFVGKVGLLYGLSESAAALFTGLVYVFVCLKAWAGAFGVGAITQYVGAVTALAGHTSKLIRIVGMMRSNLPFLQTTYDYLDLPNNMYQGSLTTEKRSDRQYEIEFRDVSFHYPGAETWALRHASIRFRVGQRLAVVGENGSGKSTFIKLLCRLYDPQEGEILLNGIDIRKYNYREYMEIFSVVFQDFRLLAQPLGANVAGSREYDREQVKRSLREAGFAKRLTELPKGLDTPLYKEFTEDGIELSGGEAQKVAIARALYKNAPFLILDEPTAALDPVAEAEIYSKFNEIAGDRTAIYISHRLSSCKFCDEILVFHQGRVVQKGRHEELLRETGGKYYVLWNAQAQYYVDL